jgi:proteasomal ATPase-associated factor 1
MSLTLPVVTIQPTFPEVIQEVLDGIIPSDKFWVSCYKTSETSVHAKVHVELDEIDRNLVNLSSVEGDVEVLKASNGVSLSLNLIVFISSIIHFQTYKVACKSLGISPTQIITPVQEYKDQERSNSARVSFTAIPYFDLSSLFDQPSAS